MSIENNTSSDLEQHLSDNSMLISQICQAMQECLRKTFPDTKKSIDASSLEYHLERDPASGSDSVIGTWRDVNQQKKGMFALHADKSFYAEYDIVLPHPKRHELVIEAITAWGRNDLIKTEAKLMDAFVPD